MVSITDSRFLRKMLAATNDLDLSRRPSCTAELSIAVLVRLAQEAETRECFAQAEAFFSRACEQAKSYFGPETVAVATILWDLASIYEKQGRTMEADDLCSEVRQILGIHRQKKRS